MPIVCARYVAVLAALAASSLAFADPPTVGSPNVAVADPEIPPPPTEPCVVSLFEDFTFIGFDAQTFDYVPPADCPGPWQKVVFTANFDVTAGRQFDRTATIWVGGANIYFGTTAEPSANVAPSWQVQRDVTDYSSLFTTAQTGRVDLGNVVDNMYTGIIHGSASLAFYPLVSTSPDQPPRPDVVLPIAADATGGVVNLSAPGDFLAATFALPTNIRRAFLDVIAQAQNSDEFWYLCVPDDVAGELESCPGTGFREAEVSIDGILAGVAPIYPWIYTGGIDPYLWRPSPGIQTLSFEPYRVDLTPYAAWLSSGDSPHRIAVSVFNVQPYFSTTANLLLYLDPGSAQVTGDVTLNTLQLPTDEPSTDLTSDADSISGTVNVTSTRDFEISGFANTSDGTITTDLTQHIAFSNAQTFAIDSATYHQQLQQSTVIDTTTTIDTGTYSHVLTEHRDWPLSIDYEFDVAADGSASQATSIEQGLNQSDEIGVEGFPSRQANLTRQLTAADTLLFDSDGNLTGRSGQSSAQSYSYLDPYGACYNRAIAAADGVLTALDDGAGCPDDTNSLSWFDAFENTGSAIFGATVEILP